MITRNAEIFLSKLRQSRDEFDKWFVKHVRPTMEGDEMLAVRDEVTRLKHEAKKNR